VAPSASGAIATAGRFTADGSGIFTNVVLDEKQQWQHNPLADWNCDGSYTVDPNLLGGETMNLTDSRCRELLLHFLFDLAQGGRFPGD